MKKILIVYDGTNYPTNLLDFVVQLNRLEPLTVSGVFLSPMDFTALWAFPVLPGTAGPYIAGQDDILLDKDQLNKNIRHFEEVCIANSITFKIHNNTEELVFEEVKKESRFADMMIISSEHFYKQFGEQPNEYLKEILHTSECGVLLLPDNFVFPKKLILTYDGSESSVFAIKQFAYLFPELCKLDTVIVYASEKDNEFPDQVLMEELILRHYNNVHMHLLHADASKELPEWLNEQHSGLIVSGSFGRTAFSQLFKKSTLSKLIKEHRIPLFIAHK